MDFEHGIPPEHRTLVAVPTMLTSAAGIEHLLEGLEVRYLANRDPCLHFALVTDFVDAAAETLPGDAELVRLAREGIERLNEKYADVRGDIFYLFHRARRWNAQEGVWMGYERKRGKLADLNATLRGAEGRFAEVVGQTAILQGVRYVITLDTDTQLPRDAARLMVGTLAHRLNRPVFDAQCGRVVDGYTILQPRVGVSLPSAQRSRFVQLYADDPGVDPYTRVVSDVYQDLFGEGSFIGKGIYDVDSFEQCCGDFPDNAILSHDLIEGAYCRSGLLSDVTLYEEHPSRYAADIARRHRWMRGDWQIAAWLLPWVRGRSGQRVRNPISALSRWKIFDNLRRSLVPVAMLLVLLVSWFVSPAIAAASLLFLASVVLLPTLFGAAADLLRKPVDLPLGMHLRVTLQSLGRPLAHSVLDVRLLAVRGVHQRRCDHAHAGAHGLDQTAAARMEDRERFGTRRRRQPAGYVSLDGFRARAGRRGLLGARLLRSRGVALRGPLARRVAGFAAGRLVAEPADSRPRRDCPRASSTFSRSCRGRRGGTLRSSSRRKTIGCRRTTSSRIPAWWSRRGPVRRTSAWRCSPTWRPTISATAPPRSCWRARSARSTRCRAWSAIGGISSTGTTRGRSRRCIPATFRWSIAAIWRRTCWCSAAAARN